MTGSEERGKKRNLKKIKKNLKGRRMWKGCARQGYAIRKSAAIKEMRREDALSSGVERTGGFDSHRERGEERKREAVEEVCDGAFTEEKPSCSLVEKSNLVTERLTDRASLVARSARPSSRDERNATRVRKRDRATLYRSTIELR